MPATVRASLRREWHDASRPPQQIERHGFPIGYLLMFKAAMLELAQARLSALVDAVVPLGRETARDLAVDPDGASHDGHLANPGDQVDLTFGLRGEVETIADAAGEAIGIGPVAGITLDAGSARLSALQAQKQLAMEAVSIVNAAPQALMNLLS